MQSDQLKNIGKSKYYFIGVFTLLGVGLLPSIIGCGKPSFPKEELIQSIKKMCTDEYHIDIESKITGKNFGTYVVLENIFDREQGLSKEASDHIGDILLGVSRVSLSTDAPLDFYTVIAADKGIPGVEAVFTRYVSDVRRYLLGSISRDDFFQRLMIDIRFNPAVLAERTILNFFSNLSTGNTRSLLANYLRRSSESTEFSLAFLRMILEMKLKDNVNFQILKMKTKPLPQERTLVYCKVKETFTPREGYTSKEFTFPSGFDYEYLFLIGATNYLPEIREVVPIDYKAEDGKFEKRAFPEEYKPYENIDDWPKADFLLDDLTLPQFLAGQMAQRIVRKVRELEDAHLLNKDATEKEKTDNKQEKTIQEENKTKIDYHVESVKGHYIHSADEKDIKSPSFQIDFKISEANVKETIPKNLYELSFDIIKDVIEKYKFDDFKEVRLSSTSSKDFKIIPKNAVVGN